MQPCDTSKYNCGTLIPSSCVPYTGSGLTILADPTTLPCNANVNDVIFLLDASLKGVLVGSDLTNLNPQTLIFNPATITVAGLNQVLINQISANLASIEALQILVADLNIGASLIAINLGCLTPSAAACITPQGTYPLIAVLNTLVSEICALKAAVGI